MALRRTMLFRKWFQKLPRNKAKPYKHILPKWSFYSMLFDDTERTREREQPWKKFCNPAAAATAALKCPLRRSQGENMTNKCSEIPPC